MMQYFLNLKVFFYFHYHGLRENHEKFNHVQAEDEGNLEAPLRIFVLKFFCWIERLFTARHVL